MSSRIEKQFRAQQDITTTICIGKSRTQEISAPSFLWSHASGVDRPRCSDASKRDPQKGSIQVTPAGPDAGQSSPRRIHWRRQQPRSSLPNPGHFPEVLNLKSSKSTPLPEHAAQIDRQSRRSLPSSLVPHDDLGTLWLTSRLN